MTLQPGQELEVVGDAASRVHSRNLARPRDAVEGVLDVQESQEIASRLPRAERLAERIAISVMRGEIAAGERLREEDLSAVYGVSRGPIREALRILEGDGFVRIEPYRGASVAVVSEHDVRAALEMQVALFAAAARLAATHASGEQIAQLQAFSASLVRLAEDRAIAPEQFIHESLQGTWLVIRAAGSDRLSRTIRSLRRMTRPDRWILGVATKAKQKKASAQWARLIDAIARRDPDKSEELARVRVRQIQIPPTSRK